MVRVGPTKKRKTWLAGHFFSGLSSGQRGRGPGSLPRPARDSPCSCSCCVAVCTSRWRLVVSLGTHWSPLGLSSHKVPHTAGVIGSRDPQVPPLACGGACACLFHAGVSAFVETRGKGPVRCGTCSVRTSSLCSLAERRHRQQQHLQLEAGARGRGARRVPARQTSSMTHSSVRGAGAVGVGGVGRWWRLGPARLPAQLPCAIPCKPS